MSPIISASLIEGKGAEHSAIEWNACAEAVSHSLSTNVKSWNRRIAQCGQINFI
jgi:hypothetical protein